MRNRPACATGQHAQPASMRNSQACATGKHAQPASMQNRSARARAVPRAPCAMARRGSSPFTPPPPAHDSARHTALARPRTLRDDAAQVVAELARLLRLLAVQAEHVVQRAAGLRRGRAGGGAGEARGRQRALPCEGRCAGRQRRSGAAAASIPALCSSATGLRAPPPPARASTRLARERLRQRLAQLQPALARHGAEAVAQLLQLGRDVGGGGDVARRLAHKLDQPVPHHLRCNAVK